MVSRQGGGLTASLPNWLSAEYQYCGPPSQRAYRSATLAWPILYAGHAQLWAVSECTAECTEGWKSCPDPGAPCVLSKHTRRGPRCALTQSPSHPDVGQGICHGRKKPYGFLKSDMGRVEKWTAVDKKGKNLSVPSLARRHRSTVAVGMAIWRLGQSIGSMWMLLLWRWSSWTM